MKCEIMDRDQRIDDFLLAKLSPEDADAFEIHLFGCPECFEELRLREQMVKLIKEERVTAVEDYARQRSPKPAIDLAKSIVEFLRFKQNVWIYAGAAAVLLIGFFITQLLRRQEAPDIYAANFVELPHLESRVGQTFRSGDFSLAVFAPKIGENFTGEILFRWEMEKDGEKFTGPLELKILDNRENLVHAATVESRQYNFKENLAPGLYYWTLDDRGETLYVGKFFVNQSQK
ncbi:MAG: zf-HC2 domain-containing protein [bacterium]